MRRRWIQIDGELVEVDQDYAQEPVGQGPLVMGDIQPYQSMVDGRMIEGRRQHREHLRAHRLIEVGNETAHLLKPKQYQRTPGLKDTLIREVHRAKDAQRAGRKYEPH